jgi:methylmalonyl-CoA carboxyltransferase small subunit
LKLKISIDGKQYDVEVEVAEEERPSSGPYYYVPPAGAATMPSPPPLPPPPGSSAAGGNVDEGKVCRSPIAGVTVRINAQLGQQIQANDPILVLEAMKMETNITSPVSGKVKTLHTTVGEGVQIGQVLVEFE